jgi:antitoxin MazE
MAAKRATMELKVSKWGNSLAVRLPAEASRKIGVGEGDTLVAEIEAGGRMVLAAKGRAVAPAAIRRLRRFLAGQKETAPVVAEMRREARY